MITQVVDKLLKHEENLSHFNEWLFQKRNIVKDRITSLCSVSPSGFEPVLILFQYQSITPDKSRGLLIEVIETGLPSLRSVILLNSEFRVKSYQFSIDFSFCSFITHLNKFNSF